MDLSAHIDHTLLLPGCRLTDIKQLCQEAIQHGFAAVCVPPFYVGHAAKLLDGHPVKVATVVGYPMGYNATPSKVEEIKRAIDDGADEIEAVANLCATKNNNWNFVANDIDSMATAAHIKGKTIKMIFETELLTEEEIGRLCEIALNSQVDYIKAGTGFNGQEASLEAVHLLHRLAGDKAKVAAFGGAFDQQGVEQFVNAGARRVSIATAVGTLG